MLLDQYGRPVQFELLKQEQAAPTLTGVRNIYSIIDSSLGLTPDKIVMILRQAEWGDPRWFMFDWISGQQLLVRSLRTEGPEIPAGPVGTGAQPQLSPWNVRVVSGGHEIGFQPATQPLAPFKFITHITRAKAGLPIRGGLARIAMWNYLFRNYILKDWVVFLEVYSQPLRLGKYGPGATEQDKRALLSAVANIGVDAAAIIPESMMIEFCESKQSQAHADSYLKAIENLDKRLTIAVLGQELTTQLPRGAGSRAAAEVHDAVRRDIAADDARRLSTTISRDLLRPLIDLNRGPRVRYPKVAIGFAEERDLALLAPALGAFVDRGLRVSQKQIRGIAGLDQPEAGEEILHPAGELSGDSSPPPGPGRGRG